MLALNSTGAVHLFRFATTSSFIYKYSGGNPSVQHEGLIYTFFISYNHHFSPQLYLFSQKKKKLSLSSTENTRKNITKRRKMNELKEAKY